MAALIFTCKFQGIIALPAHPQLRAGALQAALTLEHFTSEVVPLHADVGWFRDGIERLGNRRSPMPKSLPLCVQLCQQAFQAKLVRRCVFAMLLLTFASLSFAGSVAKDPGVRQGPPGAGAPLQGLTPVELALFEEGIQRAIQLEAVCDDCADLTLGSFTDPSNASLVAKTNSAGLGVRFNGDQCLACHNQPTLGGSGGFMVPNPQDPPGQRQSPENPMFRLIPHRKGATNYVPSFIEQFGPIREVRFAKKADGTAGNNR